MKITNEQIREMFVRNGFRFSNETGDDLKQYVYNAALELIALAQEVEPLKFDEGDDGDLSSGTSVGEYLILAPETVGEDWILVAPCGTEIGFLSKSRAVEIANDIHKAKIIKGLKYGDGE